MFRRWVPAGLIAVAVALALAGGAVLAAGGADDERRTDIFERAADILGIEASQLQDAHDQATREAQDAQLAGIVEKLVATEVVTQAEADELTTWVEARPDVADTELVSKLAGSVLGKPGIRIEAHRFKHDYDGDITARMAEILGIDQDDLTAALEGGASESAAQERLALMRAAIDSLLDSGDITADEAAELHTWVDTTPQWVLEFETSTRLGPTLSLFGEKFGDSPFLKKFPFGRDHFGKGKHDFDFNFEFEHRGPDGTFRFGPDYELHEPPFDAELFNGIFERFHDDAFGESGEFRGFEELLERLRERGFYSPPFIEPLDPEAESETGAPAVETAA